MKQILALDCGGSITRAGLYSGEKELLAEVEGGPSNPAVCGVRAAAGVVVDLAGSVLGHGKRAEAVAAGVAGADNAKIRDLLAAELSSRLNADLVVISDDRWPLLLANAIPGGGVVVTAGTGSNVSAYRDSGQTSFVGGRGPILGDEGSAYALAARALRACAHHFDGIGPRTGLTHGIVAATGCQEPSVLGKWAVEAKRHEIAALAKTVVACAHDNDPVAMACIEKEAALLAGQTLSAYKRLSLPDDTPVFLNGGLFSGSILFTSAFQEALERARPGIVCSPARVAGHRAVLEMALDPHASGSVTIKTRGNERISPDENFNRTRSMVRLMNKGDARAADAVAREELSIAKAVETAAQSFGRGGRLIYAGAGTRGRLGVLDAAECPPTFGVPPGMVVGLLAGGEEAFSRSVEAAEDDERGGADHVAAVDPPVNERDFLVGISASGTTPYVLGALAEARKRGASTALITCTVKPGHKDAALLVIALDTGDEVVEGSTRLKAGSATKMVLNSISTCAMTLSGYVYDGLMIGVRPVNVKLRSRAVGIIQTLAKVERDSADELLDKAGGSVAAAILMARKGMSGEDAAALLDSCKGSLRAALDQEPSDGEADP